MNHVFGLPICRTVYLTADLALRFLALYHCDHLCVTLIQLCMLALLKTKKLHWHN